jgi:hypothetical protein
MGLMSTTLSWNIFLKNALYKNFTIKINNIVNNFLTVQDKQNQSIKCDIF